MTSLPAEASTIDTSSDIALRTDRSLTPEEFIDVLRRSGLAERRPVDDLDRVSGMLQHANLTVTAWDGEKLVGVSRCVTDFAYCCYCSDLAVDRAYQGRGIGKALLNASAAQLHPEAKLFLRAAPAAITYYEHIGMPRLDDFFVILPGAKV